MTLDSKMKGIRLLVTSVVRYAGQKAASGFVRVIDFKSKRILMKSAVPESAYRVKDPNPRGGLRGARGVSVYGDRLVIANTERLLIFDLSWKLISEITHPWMGAIHDILAEEDGIWITCTGSDLLLKVDWAGKVIADWEWRFDKNLTEKFGFRNLAKINRKVDYRDPESHWNGDSQIIHLNSLTRGQDGLLLSFGRIFSPAFYKKRRIEKAIYRLPILRRMVRLVRPLKRKPMSQIPAVKISGTSSAIILLREDGSSKILKYVAGTNVPNHNVIQVGNSLIYNDSNGGKVVSTSLNGKCTDRMVDIPGQPNFVRGLVQLDKYNFLVGSQSPAAIYQVDLESCKVVSTFLLNGQPNESVYGICIIPTEFNDPPIHLN